jgi:hypothetical protein
MSINLLAAPLCVTIQTSKDVAYTTTSIAGLSGLSQKTRMDRPNQSRRDRSRQDEISRELMFLLHRKRLRNEEHPLMSLPYKGGPEDSGKILEAVCMRQL